MLLLVSSFNCGAAPLKIVSASDSTAAVFPPGLRETDRLGPGVLQFFYDQCHRGRPGLIGLQFQKSFYNEGKGKVCLAAHANYYFIQFRHNDSKINDRTRYTDPETTFKSYLSNYINQARAQGGIPGLLTPPTRRKYQSEHVLKRDSLENYAQAVREPGCKMNVPVPDDLPNSVKFYESIGLTRWPAKKRRSRTTPPYQCAKVVVGCYI